MKQTAVLDVREFIDEQPFSGYQFLIASLCAMVVFIDGFDAQVMGPVGPSLMAQLHIARSAFGSVISSGTLGMMVGALIFGPVADRVGRKPVLVACALAFGAGSLLTATATSVTQLMAFRVFTGFGMGGAMPNAIALTSEYMPKRSRNTAVMTMFCGFSFGSAFAGWTVAALIRNYGWQSIFLVGGSIPIVVAVLLIALLPESIRFLVVRGGQKETHRQISAAHRAGDCQCLTTSSVEQTSIPAEIFCCPAVCGRPRCCNADALGDVLHEPAEPLVPEQLAADHHE